MGLMHSVSLTLVSTAVLSFASPVSVGGTVSVTDVRAQARCDRGAFQESSGESEKISGEPNGLAIAALPPRDYEPLNFLRTDYVLQEDGTYQSKRVMTIEFEADATIGDVNTALQSVQAEVIGVLPGHPDYPELGGIFLDVRVPSDTPGELQAYIEALLNEAAVRDAYAIRVKRFLSIQ